jgi:hypothetical protein
MRIARAGGLFGITQLIFFATTRIVQRLRHSPSAAVISANATHIIAQMVSFPSGMGNGLNAPSGHAPIKTGTNAAIQWRDAMNSTRQRGGRSETFLKTLSA